MSDRAVTETIRNASRLDCRHALEALRNGVPNSHAVRLLGSNQEAAERTFRELLAETRHQGMLISGDFGSGKSHALAHFQELALAQNFVCSKVAISKETPLYDLGRVFVAAVENARMPDRGGRLMDELWEAVRNLARESPFLGWADSLAKQGTLSAIFPATVAVMERSGDPDHCRAIESFWSGGRIYVAQVRKGLREIGLGKHYRFTAPRVSELPPQQLRFAAELVRVAGYKGWVVLLDEVELVASYSILQRARSYAEVARWLGKTQGQSYPGLVVAGSVTEDFATAVISPDGKQDCDNVAPKLRSSARHANLVEAAQAGMTALQRECQGLRAPTDGEVVATVERLRAIYAKAHDWSPEPLDLDAGGAGFEGRMRYKVRAAINTWDLIRLVPGARPATEFEAYSPDYGENPDLENPDPDEFEP